MARAERGKTQSSGMTRIIGRTGMENFIERFNRSTATATALLWPLKMNQSRYPYTITHGYAGRPWASRGVSVERADAEKRSTKGVEVNR